MKKATKGQLSAAVSAWQDFFGHFKVLDRNFNEVNYPLEPETDEVVEELGFDEIVLVRDAAKRATEMGFSLPGPRACGKYILAQSRVQVERRLVGIGAEWRLPSGIGVMVPIFIRRNDKPEVCLCFRNDELDSNYRFLVSRRPGQK